MLSFTAYIDLIIANYCFDGNPGWIHGLQLIQVKMRETIRRQKYIAERRKDALIRQEEYLQYRREYEHWMRVRPNLPRDIAFIIVEYIAKPKLRKWVRLCYSKLDWHAIYANPEAYDSGDLLFIDRKLKTYPRLYPKDNEIRNLIRNPSAGKYIHSNIKYLWNEPQIWANPGALNILLELRPDDIYWSQLSRNPHPKVVELIKSIPNIYLLNPSAISKNPLMIDFLRKHPNMIDEDRICANPAAVDIIKKLREINWEYLSMNRHPWAIEQLEKNPDKVNWKSISADPHPWSIEQLKNNPEKINWKALCVNPHPWAIEQLKHNQDKIDWEMLSENPGIYKRYINKDILDLLS